MSAQEMATFHKQCDAAKQKELKGFAATGSYRKETYDSDRHLNTVQGRWVMTWKPVDPKGEKDTNPEGEEETPELPSTPLPTSGWSVQVGAYPNLKEAEEHTQRIIEEGQQGYILTASVNGETWYRVRIAGYPTKAAAQEAKKALQIKHQEFDYFIFKAP